MSIDLAILLRWGPFVLLVLYAAAFIAGTRHVERQGTRRVYALDATAIQEVSQAAFRVSFVVLFGVFSLRAPWPLLEQFAGPVGWAQSPYIQSLGVVVMLAGAVLAAAAQYQMGRAWRIGVPDQDPAHLTTHGLFRFSRNPVFLGMAAIFVGALLVVPNALTLLALGLAIFAMSIQIRLEESHLSSRLGSVYETYKTRVRRWI